MRETRQAKVEEILASMEGARRAQSPAGLFYKIEARIAGVMPVVKTVPFRTVSLAAASIVLLFFINLLVIKANETSPAPRTDGAQQLAEYYGLTDNLGI